MPPLPPSVVLMQMVTGLWVSKLVGEMARVGIADLLVDGPRTAQELAPQVGLNASALYRAMRALASIGVFTQDEHDRFGLTELSDLLRSDVPSSVRAMAVLQTHHSHYQAWGALQYSLETGQPSFDNVYGDDFFSYAARTPETQDVFNDAMTSLAGMAHVAASEAYDFSQFESLMDVGGGHGTLISAICARTPNLRGVLFDLPHVVEGADHVFEKWGVAGRVEKRGGDFFASVPGPVDACILSTVIHDWGDEHSLKILKNCHAATREGGKLLLVEGVVPAGTAPSFAKFLDINMLVLTNGGRERTEQEYRELFAKAGYELTNVYPTQALTSIVEGVRL